MKTFLWNIPGNEVRLYQIRRGWKLVPSFLHDTIIDQILKKTE